MKKFLSALIFLSLTVTNAFAFDQTSWKTFETEKSAAWKTFETEKSAAWGAYAVIDKEELAKLRTTDKASYFEWLDARQRQDFNAKEVLEKSRPAIAAYVKTNSEQYKKYQAVESAAYTKFKAAESVSYEKYKAAEAAEYKKVKK
jgi:hypothetical protein